MALIPHFCTPWRVDQDFMIYHVNNARGTKKRQFQTREKQGNLLIEKIPRTRKNGVWKEGEKKNPKGKEKTDTESVR